MLALGSGLPAVVVALVLLWTASFPPGPRWAVTIGILLAWAGLALMLRDRIVLPFHTITSMLEALREGDYSIRTRAGPSNDAVGHTLREVNLLGERLRRQRLDAVEATALLSRVIETIDVAILTFDHDRRLQLINRSAQHLAGGEPGSQIGRSADELHLSHLLDGPPQRILDTSFAGRMGRWELRRSRFRQDGRPHTLVVLTDLTRTLRQEERQAWQRLVQVLRHEINNSLAPIQSLAGTLRRILDRDPRPAEWETDLGGGLRVIGERASALGRFMAAYTRLTGLPDPALRPVDVGTWIHRVAALESRARIEVVAGPPARIIADGDQLDQVLINLVRNSVEAFGPNPGTVRIGWAVRADALDVWVEDNGPGLSNTDNLFVPFFTTKPDGSGIGLVISRQIAEAHGGDLRLQNRTDGPGCVAHLRLPIVSDKGQEPAPDRAECH